MKPSPGEHEEARRYPNGHVYRIDGRLSARDGVPPERIIGAWKVDETGKITGDFIPSPAYIPSAAKTRKAGLIKLLLGGVVFGLILVGFFLMAARNMVPNNPFLLMPAGFPFAVFCAGVIECISGVPFQRLAHGWMELRGWQRGVLGTFIVLTSLVVIICIVTLVAMHM